MSTEFELIELFRSIGADYYKENGIVVGPGDDCAIFDIKTPIVTSVDSSLVDVHFPSNAPAEDIAYRSVAIALSDIAAMGCKPLAFSLAVSALEENKNWYKEMADGVNKIAEEFKIALIGGDLTRGPLNINVVAYGTPYAGNEILMRNNAQPGDIICISKPTGRARKGLIDWKMKNYDSVYIKDYFRPLPQIKLGKEIANIASACIDTSDGLLADLNKMLRASECGALINIDRIPITTDLDDLNYGDDYDLCFTIPAAKLKNNYFKIGEVTLNKEIKLISDKGYDVSIKGYEHF